MLVTDDTSQLDRSALILLDFKNAPMSVTSEVSKHPTLVLFETFSANIASLLSFDNTKLVSLKQGGGVVVNANCLKKSNTIENLIEFVFSNK